MKNKIIRAFTYNWGFKLISILCAIILWLVVVNIDDPVISKTYSGIPVEVLNENVLTDEDRTYEVIDSSDTITVVVSAKRSIINQMSKDYVRASADLRYISVVDNTVPIEVKSTRLADKIESVSTRTDRMKLKIENLITATIPVTVMSEGSPDENYILKDATPNVRSIKVSGPESLVTKVGSVVCNVDISDTQNDFTTSAKIVVLDKSGEEIEDERLVLSHASVTVEVRLNGVKEVPITSGYSGEPMDGFIATGSVYTNPASIAIAGDGENFEDMDVIYIDPEDVSVEGAYEDVTAEVSILNYLPTGVTFADKDFEGNVVVGISVAQKERKMISVPVANITVDNVPEGYQATIISIEDTVSVEIEGLGDTFDRFDGSLAIGHIDATALSPRVAPSVAPLTNITVGENEGTVVFDWPADVKEREPLVMPVVVSLIPDADAPQTEGTEGEEETAAQ